ncbi:undecaprenyl/decaprenyl-phosphate alpha-N-acetylglucosaminyl 1-phosphate transferase [Candidatus Dojkabacteria bacterium]|nr:undecaprenyl/decaprenyl-phosphate alpha-N-acetylglucosaminyl 1-phosphate transferase [Candidatus Dojkabacteria bacterium]
MFNLVQTINNYLPDNYHPYTKYLPLFLISILITLFSTPIAGYVARKFNIIGKPPSQRDGKKFSDRRHLEKQPLPKFGGTAVIIPLLIICFVTLKPDTNLLFLLAGVSVLVVMGIIDDIYEISATAQYSAQMIAAILIFISPMNLSFISTPFGGTIDLDWWNFLGKIGEIPFEIILPGDLFLIGWILVCINAVKWVGGADGLIEGNSFLGFLALFLLSVRVNEQIPATVSITMAGLLFGFLFYNFKPAKIMSGSPGKSTYGYILAVLGLLSGAKIMLTMIILMMPLTDFVIVIVGRIIKYKPKSFKQLMSISDQSHLHHRLLNLGLTESTVAFVEYLISAVMAAIALAFSGAMKGFALLLAFIIIAIFTYLIFKVANKIRKEKNKPQGDTPEQKYSY